MSFAGGLKTIVVATDLEGRSEAALEYARKLASGYGARIILAHGTDPLKYAVVDGVPGRVWQKLSEQARAALDEMSADLLREGIHSHSEIRQGTVVDMLMDVAKQYEAGLIVIGTKGRQGAGPIAVGAITEELVRKSNCPVLAVAADWNAGEFRPVPGGPVFLHMDHHGMVFDPSNSSHIYAACDGGVFYSGDTGATWDHRNSGFRRFSSTTWRTIPNGRLWWPGHFRITAAHSARPRPLGRSITGRDKATTK